MYAPGGFNAIIETWSTQGVYARIKLLDHLPKNFSCIVFDRRECGKSGGRVERVTWAHYVKQGKGLLDHLGIPRAHIMGGCMGCSPVTPSPSRTRVVLRIILYWPVGGARYRIASHQRFSEHLGFVQSHGLGAVVSLVTKEGKPFGADPRGGPWAAVISMILGFAAAYAEQNPEQYKLICAGMCRAPCSTATPPPAPSRRSHAPRHPRARGSGP